MAVSRSQKAEQLKELKDKMQKSASIVFAHYMGLNVADVSDLRNKLRENKAEMKVAKKTLMQIAAKDLGMPEISDELLDGAVACIFCYEDPIQGAQTAFGFAKDHPQVELIGGIFEGKILSKADAVSLAKTPSKPVLLATFMRMIQSPLTTFASQCSSPLIGFARVVDELAKKGGVPAKAA